ncbi:hypothetical protein FFJ24_015295 [Pedobacter sp. KBS0701]|uniref:hypothetical protein n=2 Tax=unclassified Pedobacter TaxID=2628915 RepID=UPI00110EC7F7|nr:hypothetical protein [Pedobacter sp. KBS0701]QDW26105.1 hypothetical protein FFJ24_015295 [Pedobacter sp. KBS0701]
MNKQISQAIGWALGVLIIFPLLIYGINYFFKNRSNDSRCAIHDYINNSSEYKIFIPHNTEVKTFSYRTSFSAPQSNYYTLRFRDAKKGKWISFIFFNYPMDRRLAFDAVMDEKEALLTINKDDLNNPNYGTKENPIPVFKVRENLPDSVSMKKGEENGWNVDITDKQFKYNVEQYLTYIMPKEEFQERFEKK